MNTKNLSKMLFSRMIGGLGNQLFQIAACLKYKKLEEKVIISFLGDIHIPRRENCLGYIFEKPEWLYYDNSQNLNQITRLIARNSAYLRFGSYLPIVSINDRNFNSNKSRNSLKNTLFLDGYFNKNWTYSSLNNTFNKLKLRRIGLGEEYLQNCREDVIIHIRGGDFLNIPQLNICKLDYYKKSIRYFIMRGHKSFKVISEDRKYANELINQLKNYFIDIKITKFKKDSIKNDFNIIRSSRFAILSNSTFSWWASFLSKTKKEFIVPYYFSLKEKRMLLPNEIEID